MSTANSWDEQYIWYPIILNISRIRNYMPQRIKISIPPKYKSSGANNEIEVEVDHIANLDTVIDRALEMFIWIWI
jgi:hypothetical protein